MSSYLELCTGPSQKRHAPKRIPTAPFSLLLVHARESKDTNPSDLLRVLSQVYLPSRVPVARTEPNEKKGVFRGRRVYFKSTTNLSRLQRTRRCAVFRLTVGEEGKRCFLTRRRGCHFSGYLEVKLKEKRVSAESYSNTVLFVREVFVQSKTRVLRVRGCVVGRK